MTKDLYARKGILRIKSELIDSGIAKPILEELTIVRCEYMVIYNWYEYHAYCEHFRPIPEEEMAPEYEAIIHEPGGDPTGAYVEFLEVK